MTKRTPFSGDSLSAGFRDRVHGDSGSPGAWLQHATPSRRKHLFFLQQLLDGRTLKTPEELQHISHTHPFSHRPLVEYMLTIPASLVCRPNQPRRLMRGALAATLPPAVLHRKSKTSYSGTFLNTLRPFAAEMLHSKHLQLEERGYLDRGSLKLRLHRLLQGLECNESQLRCVILLEAWLQQRENIEGGRPWKAAVLAQ